MNFVDDLKHDARAWLRTLGYKDAETVSDTDVTLTYYRLQERLPTATPRSFEVSRRHRSRRNLSTVEKQGLRDLEREVQSGASLLPRLPTGALRSAHDGLLNDWGIFHFHLGAPRPGHSFVGRTTHAAFALLTEDRFLLIGVYPHEPQPYEDIELLRIAQATWPEVLSRSGLKKDFRLVHDFSQPETIRKMRESGISMLHEVNGVVHMPHGGGMTTDGGSVNALMRRNSVYNQLGQLERRWITFRPGLRVRVRLLGPHDVLFQEAQRPERFWKAQPLDAPLPFELLPDYLHSVTAFRLVNAGLRPSLTDRLC